MTTFSEVRQPARRFGVIPQEGCSDQSCRTQRGGQVKPAQRAYERPTIATRRPVYKQSLSQRCAMAGRRFEKDP